MTDSKLLFVSLAVIISIPICLYWSAQQQQLQAKKLQAKKLQAKKLQANKLPSV
jgi:hypothetical protein